MFPKILRIIQVPIIIRWLMARGTHSGGGLTAQKPTVASRGGDFQSSRPEKERS